MVPSTRTSLRVDGTVPYLRPAGYGGARDTTDCDNNNKAKKTTKRHTAHGGRWEIGKLSLF
jgi:hypothetical protein